MPCDIIWDASLVAWCVGTFVQLVGVWEAFFPVPGGFDSVRVRDLGREEPGLGFAVLLPLDDHISGLVYTLECEGFIRGIGVVGQRE